MSRYFHGLIFLGGGEISVQEIDALKVRLAHGVRELGGLQQPDHPESEEAAVLAREARLAGQREVEDVVRDIAAALLGREIQIGEKLPYPSENARSINGVLVRPPV